MKGCRVWLFCAACLLGASALFSNAVWAQEKGIPTEAIKNAYRQILANTDKNGDGKISLQECVSISKDQKKMEKDCKYWDADGDGLITEDEYVQQVKKLGAKKGRQ
jgi:Ca2+-binding EF-hand superfamily protein